MVLFLMFVALGWSCTIHKDLQTHGTGIAGIRLVEKANVTKSFDTRIVNFRSGETGEFISFSPVWYRHLYGYEYYLLDTSNYLVDGYSNCSHPIEKVNWFSESDWEFAFQWHKSLDGFNIHRIYMESLQISDNFFAEPSFLRVLNTYCGSIFHLVFIVIYQADYIFTYIQVNVYFKLLRLIVIIRHWWK